MTTSTPNPSSTSNPGPDPAAVGRPAFNTIKPALPTVALIAWTLFVWGGRIRNVFADESLTGWSRVWRAGLATGFVVAALLAAAGLAHSYLTTRSDSQGGGRVDGTTPFGRLSARLTATTLAVVGIGVWTVRGLDIALGDHSAAFIAVHVVLAVVTITLGIAVLRSPLGIVSRQDLLSGSTGSVATDPGRGR